MAKKKGKSGGSRGGEDDASTVASTSSLQRSDDEPECEALDGFTEAVEALFEKRASTRVSGLERLCAFLRQDVRVEDCTRNASTIVGRCRECMKKGSDVESALAATLLGLLMLTLEDASEAFLQTFQPDLERTTAAAATVGKGGSSAAVVSAIEALAMCCFVAQCEDDMLTRRVLARLRSCWRSGNPAMRSAALHAWSFLFTSLDSSPSPAEAEGLLTELAKLLQHTDVSTRAAAGEAVALLYHTCGFGSFLDDFDEADAGSEEYGTVDGRIDDSPYISGGGFIRGSSSGVHGEGEESHVLLMSIPIGRASDISSADSSTAAMDDVVTRMRELAGQRGVDSPMRPSKGDRAAVKKTFRGLLASLEQGAPRIKVKLQHGSVLEVDTVLGGVQLSFIRRYLGSGFQEHAQHNPLLHDVFGFTPNSSPRERLGAAEKRLLKSPSSAASRARTAHRKQGRTNKSRAAGATWEADGEC